MQKLIVDVTANTVSINDRLVRVDCSRLAGVASVQWFGTAGVVIMKPVDGADEGAVERITDLKKYQVEIEQALAIIHDIDNPPAPGLTDIKAAAEMVIAAQAGMARTRGLTAGPGQELMYMEKVGEAESLTADIVAGRAYDATNYPMMFAEVGLTADDAAGVAAAVIEANKRWRTLSADIEKTRLSARRALAASQSSDEIAEIVTAIKWPVG